MFFFSLILNCTFCLRSTFLIDTILKKSNSKEQTAFRLIVVVFLQILNLKKKVQFRTVNLFENT